MIKLKYWRKKRNLTQIQLSVLVNSSVGYIYKMETGRKTPSLKMLYKLARALDVCPKELLECDCKNCKNKTPD